MKEHHLKKNNSKTSRLNHSFKEKKRALLLLIGIISLSLIFYLYIYRPAIVGFVTLIKEVSRNESVALAFSNNSQYTLQLPDNTSELKSLRLSGSFSQGAQAKIYVEYNNVVYLILDSSQTDNGLQQITGFVIFNVSETNLTNETIPIENKSAINESIINQTEPIINESLIINQSLENISIINKSITLKLKYQGNSVYDENNDGIETLTGIIDFNVNASFSWDANYGKLCTKWDIFNIETEQSTIVCYGNSDCCSLLGLVPEKTAWNETFYLNYGKYNAGSNNIVAAQLIYANYSLNIENLYSDIAYSSLSSLSAKFLPAEIRFENICIDTCLLSGFNASSYNLIINVTNGTLSIDTISYSSLVIMPNVSNEAPVLTQNISTIYIEKNSNLTILLSDYFTDPDGDALAYSYYDANNITINIENNSAIFIPDKGFTGVSYSFFKANDSRLTAISNVFTINVSKGIKVAVNKTGITLDKPAKWIKRIVLEDMVRGLTWPGGAYNITLSRIEDVNGLLEKTKMRVNENKNKISIEENESIIEMEFESPEIQPVTNDTSPYTPPKLTYNLLPSDANKANMRLYWPVNDSTVFVDFNFVCEGRIKNLKVTKSEIKNETVQ